MTFYVWMFAWAQEKHGKIHTKWLILVTLKGRGLVSIYYYCSLKKIIKVYKKGTKCSHVPETRYNKGQVQSGIKSSGGRMGVGMSCQGSFHGKLASLGYGCVIHWPWSCWTFQLKNGHIGCMGGLHLTFQQMWYMPCLQFIGSLAEL